MSPDRTFEYLLNAMQSAERFGQELAAFKRGEGSYPSSAPIVRAMRRAGLLGGVSPEISRDSIRLDALIAMEATVQEEIDGFYVRWHDRFRYGCTAGYPDPRQAIDEMRVACKDDPRLRATPSSGSTCSTLGVGGSADARDVLRDVAEQLVASLDIIRHDVSCQLSDRGWTALYALYALYDVMQCCAAYGSQTADEPTSTRQQVTTLTAQLAEAKNELRLLQAIRRAESGEGEATDPAKLREECGP